MSPIDRKLAGDLLRFDLTDERAHLNDTMLLERDGRNARTLVKNGPLRVTLIVIAPGGKIGTHRAAGPITVQVLDGEIRFHVSGQDHRLGAGDLLVLEGGMEHAVESDAGGTFLLTVIQPGASSS